MNNDTWKYFNSSPTIASQLGHMMILDMTVQQLIQKKIGTPEYVIFTILSQMST